MRASFPLRHLWLGGTLLAAGCTAGGAGQVEPAPAPTLMIVTATPGLPLPEATQRPTRRYVVREGDSLSSIAEAHNVTEAAILRANGLTDPDHILVGQELNIPPPEP